MTVEKACKITTIIFNELICELKKKSFNTEKDIEFFLKNKTLSYNCKLAFPPIVANNSGIIHAVPRNKNLTNGFLIVDFGVKYKGFCSDCTRTFYIGNPSKEDINLYNLVLFAQETSLQYAKPGFSASNLDLISRQILFDYFKNFKHALGHGVGRKIHQNPRISPNSLHILKKNQFITIEPGLYFKNKGIRVEDTVKVNNNPVILTKVKKELIIIQR